MADNYLINDLVNAKIDGLRAGFGKGLVAAGKKNDKILALCADLTESTKMDLFANEFPERFVQVGVAEQNLAALASGFASMGYIPFTSSYAAFHPGRSWEQIKTTICMNEQNVKIIGSHAGISVGPDGATHQMFEDIAIMRTMPGMTIICPGDAIEAEKATLAMAGDSRPNYLRLARASTPVFTTEKTPFKIGRAYRYRSGKDISLIGTGTMTYHVLLAAEKLSKDGIEADVIHVPTIKPLDAATIVGSAEKTGAVVTAEEGQVKGGLGGAVAELLAEEQPTLMGRIGINDHYGQSGDPTDVMKAFKLTADDIYKKALVILKNK